ncbi:2-amino-4-hydroxy-6-hydroxymethyldihydropteridine diphosphokinase [Pedobacter sp. CFBP9032]|uniref:2-amino-4-hydroxy-6- hydroxymethyldihydropteridine diphosphokinase n=1 Tax=Pedobacter sp. CFBP9032 TaxID=3096539 RepID=UPI002A6B5A67|nr:2-amino-4-hydroxy-6-hydroxymethyldihydropteridine diphosphokinase [Pedobacter sp. CFBP9032]MDY0906546.1 2-amino-4-hydroxy-6-hydroxymethyldihydropteridine diphosphokinase [Pedobacter sp. CFBP9032]
MMLNKALEYTMVYLLLGGNLGNREENLGQAVSLIGSDIGDLEAISSIYETAAWGKKDQPAFLNQAVAVKTSLTAVEVLQKALNIEQTLGRVRKEKWGERLIDIDLIFFGNEVINIENLLHVPHPQMQFRKFVMAPMAEIAPQLIHPVLDKSVLDIYRNITDHLAVRKL